MEIDCKTVRIFAYSSTREQSNEAENRERDWGETLKKNFEKGSASRVLSDKRKGQTKH